MLEKGDIIFRVPTEIFIQKTKIPTKRVIDNASLLCGTLIRRTRPDYHANYPEYWNPNQGDWDGPVRPYMGCVNCTQDCNKGNYRAHKLPAPRLAYCRGQTDFLIFKAMLLLFLCHRYDAVSTVRNNLIELFKVCWRWKRARPLLHLPDLLLNYLLRCLLALLGRLPASAMRRL